MKKLLIALLLLSISIGVNAQRNKKTEDVPRIELKTDSSIGYYQEVVKLDTSYTETMLYKRAKQWVSSTLTSNSIQLNYDSMSEGKLIFTSEQNLYIPQGVGTLPFIVRYAFTLEIKDGRYRYTINNIEFGFTTLLFSHGERQPIYQEWKDCNFGKNYNNHYKRIYALENHLMALTDALNGLMIQKNNKNIAGDF